MTTDKPDYSPEEIVTIKGNYFNPGPIACTITRPDNHVDSVSGVADGNGDFTVTYQLDGITGTYPVKCTDGTHSGSTTFTDTPPDDEDDELPSAPEPIIAIAAISALTPVLAYALIRRRKNQN